MIQIRKAYPTEACEITQLGIRSKLYWGYNLEQMSVFVQELMLQPDAITALHTHVLELDDEIIGYYNLLPHEQTVELKHLFIEPSHFRKGFGSKLLKHARSTAVSLGFRQMIILSDPNAEVFYLKHGAQLIEYIQSSIRGRLIPLLKIQLE
ncbi:hypothetical protein NIES2101_30770 [Calothrix sp. HK-06]|nr:hypothetical protein NIES2101_30770 [Calothrix sp. HK-06]